MKMTIAAILCLPAIMCLPSQQVCKAELLEMTLSQDSIYTPGKIKLALRLTDMAIYNERYQFRLGIYMAGELVRKQTLTATQGKSVLFELAFPEVFSRTEGRCRCELFIGQDFFESQEKPFTLWPQIEPYPEQKIKKKEIWTFDTSGKLQELFDKMEVKVTDATFQPAREFGSPDIVFVGQCIDPNSMRLVTDRLETVEPEPVIIYLKQKQFLKESKLEIPAENNRPQSFICDVNSILLSGLGMVDIMKMVEDTSFIKVKKDGNSGRTIKSYVTEDKKDEKNIYSYLFAERHWGKNSVYCQLPIYDGDDPRGAILLKNILNHAVEFIDSRENQINSDNERK